MEKTKYFQTLPEQEYVFKNFFTTGEKEGMCCADCGTYITRVVQLQGKADGQIYNVGTTCCDKTSKNRDLFLTPVSEQRKKIFMAQYKKLEKIISELEIYAEENGGAVLKFVDVDVDYRQDLELTVFIYCKNGAIIYNHIYNAQRCLTGLPSLLKDYNFTFDVGDLFSKSWCGNTLIYIKNIISENFKKNNPDMWSEKVSNWEAYFNKTGFADKVVYYREQDAKNVNFVEFKKKYKTLPNRF